MSRNIYVVQLCIRRPEKTIHQADLPACFLRVRFIYGQYFTLEMKNRKIQKLPFAKCLSGYHYKNITPCSGCQQ